MENTVVTKRSTSLRYNVRERKKHSVLAHNRWARGWISEYVTQIFHTITLLCQCKSGYRIFFYKTQYTKPITQCVHTRHRIPHVEQKSKYWKWIFKIETITYKILIQNKWNALNQCIGCIEKRMLVLILMQNTFNPFEYCDSGATTRQEEKEKKTDWTV